jgi:hypothetical protein
MADVYLMQAVDDSDGEIYTWLSATADFAGADYDGPGDPTEVAVVELVSDSAAVDATKLPLTGGTITGSLVVNEDIETAYLSLRDEPGGSVQANEDALLIFNNETASSGTPIRNPKATQFWGVVWDGSAGRVVRWSQQSRGVSGASAKAVLHWDYSLNFGAFATRMSLDPAAGLTVVGNVASTAADSAKIALNAEFTLLMAKTSDSVQNVDIGPIPSGRTWLYTLVIDGNDLFFAQYKIRITNNGGTLEIYDSQELDKYGDLADELAVTFDVTSTELRVILTSTASWAENNLRIYGSQFEYLRA